MKGSLYFLLSLAAMALAVPNVAVRDDGYSVNRRALKGLSMYAGSTANVSAVVATLFVNTPNTAIDARSYC
ncbi:uncharacterized protein RCC_05265 [Ramularia collo-cygni]|uniref:Uncharacterized protein n=1 Tax=Ramularia collo-cygni TaxID=112498 RepID=A0A2D3V9V9_9PEZI|nr:uncharacterized protein RCC_05265 [Ramularia collo-cygni]CZT19414.1 uncharacterized protein RCC_05265 [Ramularia collo-cygni]